jgi:hypothetical protein
MAGHVEVVNDVQGYISVCINGSAIKAKSPFGVD